MPRALKESVWVNRIKRMLGLKSSPSTSTTGARRSGYATGTTGSHKVPRGTISNDAYLQIDEDGMPMHELKASESTEYLRHGEDKKTTERIIRTTDIVVSRDEDTSRDVGGNSAQWPRRM
jgi:hypothetical protein